MPKYYIVTSAQNNTRVHPGAWRNIKAYAAWLRQFGETEIKVIPIRYKNPTSRVEGAQTDGDDVWWSPALSQYLCTERQQLAPRLALLSDVKVQATARRPLSSLSNIAGPQSTIVGHGTIACETLEAEVSEHPYLSWTTGSITESNMSDTKAGKIAEFHHVTGALIVEVRQNGIFHVRNLLCDRRGDFIDLKWEVKSGVVGEAPKAKGLLLGDLHLEHVCKTALDASVFSKNSMLKMTGAKELAVTDVIDFGCRSHHNRRSRFSLLENYANSEDNVKDALDLCCKYLSNMSRIDGVERLHVVGANHDEHIDRWLEEVDVKEDPQNAVIYHTLSLAKCQEILAGKKRKAFQLYFEDHYRGKRRSPEKINFICETGEKFGKFDFSFHGHIGRSGSRGSIQNFSSLGGKYIIFHSHKCGIRDGVIQVGGLYDKNKASYARGLNGWTATNAVVYANNQATLLTAINGEFTTLS